MPRTFDLKSILAPIGPILQRLNSRRDHLLAELEVIETEIARLGGRTRRSKRVTAENANGGIASKLKRRRRKREDLEELAGKIIEFIGSKGKQGVSGGEIKAAFGSLLPSVNAWLKNYSKSKFKTTGNKSKTRYFV